MLNRINPIISVIMPLYNAERYVSESVISVINQTYKYWELLIINDGSTDNSLAVVKQYQNEKIKVLTQVNKGASAARNYGLREAKGDYIQFLDADDLINETKFENQLNALLNERHDKLAICPTVHFFDGKDHLSEVVKHNWTKEGSDSSISFLTDLYGGKLNSTDCGGMVPVHAWLTAKPLIDEAGLWNEKLSLDDDGEFFCRVILKSSSIIYTPNAIAFYRKFKFNKNLSAQKSRVALESAILSTQLKEKHILSFTKSKDLRLALSKLYNENLIMVYPKYKDLAFICEQKIKELGRYNQPYYTHTKFYKIITLLFGWKASAWISYLKNY